MPHAQAKARASDPPATPVAAAREPFPHWRAVSAAIMVIAALGAVALLRWAEAFFIPLVAGIMIAYALRPIVEVLERLRLPRSISASAVLLLVVTALCCGVLALGDDFERAMATLPDAARKIRLALEESRREQRGPIAHVQQAAKELEQAAVEQAGIKQAAPRRAAPPSGEPGVAAQIQQFALKQAASLLGVVSQLGLAVLLAYFVLLAGDAFRRKLMHLVGPSLARKRMTIEMLEEVDTHVQRYMFVTMVTNLAIAAAVAALAAAFGLDNPVAWGIAAGLLHLVPYVGAGLAAVALAIGGLVQFGTPASAALLGAGVLIAAVAIGLVFQTWLQSRASRVNAVAVFVGLLFFGWLWGAWGLVLGAPLISITKTIADRIAPPVGELLG